MVCLGHRPTATASQALLQPHPAKASPWPTASVFAHQLTGEDNIDSRGDEVITEITYWRVGVTSTHEAFTEPAKEEVIPTNHSSRGITLPTDCSVLVVC